MTYIKGRLRRPSIAAGAEAAAVPTAAAPTAALPSPVYSFCWRPAPWSSRPSPAPSWCAAACPTIGRRMHEAADPVGQYGRPAGFEHGARSLAARAEGRRAQPASICWWTAGTVLGILFLVGPGLAWRQLKDAGIFIATNPSSSFFYVLTAAHAFHILGGVAALVYVDVQALRLRLGPGQAHRDRCHRDLLAFSGWPLDLFDGSILRLGVMDVVPSQRRCHDSVWDGGRSPYATNSKKFGMWLFIISDSLTFSALLFAYTYSRVSQSRLAHAVRFFAQHHLLHRDDVLPALQQLDHGDGGARDESRQPQGGRRAGSSAPWPAARRSWCCT